MRSHQVLEPFNSLVSLGKRVVAYCFGCCKGRIGEDYLYIISFRGFFNPAKISICIKVYTLPPCI